MQYRNRLTGAYPADIRAEHPDTSFGITIDAATASAFGYDPVDRTPPAPVAGFYFVADGAVQVGDTWFVNWVQTPMTPEMLAAEAAQASRVEARGYAKLNALKAMTPTQIKAWATANVTNTAQARDAITTLAIAVSILAREL